MKIAHINLFDIQGGAARIAWNLTEKMSQAGHDVRIFAQRTTIDDPRIIPFNIPQTEEQNTLLKRQTEKRLFDLYSKALIEIFSHDFFQQADIVHLHCINAGYFSYLLLPFLTGKSLIWTMHDTLAFTGNCLHTDYCDRWQNTNCNDCPLDGNVEGEKLNRELVQFIKGDICSISKFTVVCPSVWIKSKIEKSILGKQDVQFIPNGIDTKVFYPRDRKTVRSIHGLPQDTKIIMFAAHGGFNTHLKGGKLLIQALRKIYYWYPDLVLLNIGSSDNSVFDDLPIKRIDWPYITDPHKLADFYAASDLFISPSLAENLSLVICEASACGTPVVAFNVGGNREIIRHQQTGYLARAGDVEGLAAGICFMLDDDSFRHQAGELASKWIFDNFMLDKMTDNYMELYERMACL